MDTKNINWWKLASIILIIFNMVLISNSVIENEKSIKTHIGDISQENFLVIKEVAKNYSLTQVVNLKTGDGMMITGGYNGTS